MGWSIPIGLGEELESETNKGRPWSSKSELKQPPSLTKDGGLQAPLRCNFDPLEEIYDGLNMVEFKTNNKGYVRRVFLPQLKKPLLLLLPTSRLYFQLIFNKHVGAILTN